MVDKHAIIIQQSNVHVSEWCKMEWLMLLQTANMKSYVCME